MKKPNIILKLSRNNQLLRMRRYILMGAHCHCITGMTSDQKIRKTFEKMDW